MWRVLLWHSTLLKLKDPITSYCFCLKENLPWILCHSWSFGSHSLAVDQFFLSTASFFHLSSFWIQWEIPSVHFRRIQPVVRLCKSLCQFFSFPFCTFVLVFLFIAFRGTVFSVPISPDSEKLGPQNPNQWCNDDQNFIFWTMTSTPHGVQYKRQRPGYSYVNHENALSHYEIAWCSTS